MSTRRALIALAGAVLLAPVMQSCSSDNGSSGDKSTTINVLVGANTIYPEQQRQWFSQVSAQFAKDHNGSQVKFETFASANDELTKIQTSVLSSQGPDVYALGTTFTPTAAATGAFETLGTDEWNKVGGRDRFIPATLGISGPDTQHEVGIPFAQRPFVMAYNKDLLKAAGIDKPADSWDGLLEQAKKVTGGGKFGLAVAYADSFDPWKFIWAMSVQAGNPLVQDKKAQLTDPSTLKAYQTYLGWLATAKVVDPKAVGWKNAQAIAAFGDGKAAFLPMVSATSRSTLDKSSVAGKYAYVTMPTIPPGQTAGPANGKPATSILSGDNLVVAKYSKNKDLAFALVNQLTSADSQTAYFKLLGEMPANAQAAAALQSDPVLAPIIESATKSVATPFSGAWSQIQLALVNVVVQSIPDVAAGKIDQGKLTGLIQQAQTTAQGALDKAK